MSKKEEEIEISITPKIMGSSITEIEVQGLKLPLREKVSIDNLSAVVSSVRSFNKFIDLKLILKKLAEVKLKQLSPWEARDLHFFVLKELLETQAKAMEILAKSGEVVREKYLDEMGPYLRKKDMASLGGLLAGITLRAKSRGHESPFVIEWKIVKNDYECFYRLRRETYAEPILTAAEERMEEKE
ncbi:MAG: hypothetical protein HWN65_05465 [Candidatus Helarchaeota archaeon]|nr:hypothetical protein [Candidatus Helarchaeota archaeon]